MKAKKLLSIILVGVSAVGLLAGCGSSTESGQTDTADDAVKKDVYFIATAAAGKHFMERTMEALEGFADCLPGARVKAEIYGEGVYQKGEAENTPAYIEAYEAGKAV